MHQVTRGCAFNVIPAGREHDNTCKDDNTHFVECIHTCTSSDLCNKEISLTPDGWYVWKELGICSYYYGFSLTHSQNSCIVQITPNPFASRCRRKYRTMISWNSNSQDLAPDYTSACYQWSLSIRSTAPSSPCMMLLNAVQVAMTMWYQSSYCVTCEVEETTLNMCCTHCCFGW